MTEAAKSPIVIPQLARAWNPEPKYDQTRHNIGFAAVDAMSRSWQIPLSKTSFKGVGEGRGDHKQTKSAY